MYRYLLIRIRKLVSKIKNLFLTSGSVSLIAIIKTKKRKNAFIDVSFAKNVKIVLTYCEKHCSSNREIFFETTRTIYSNSESSEQFFETECFFNLFLEIYHI